MPLARPPAIEVNTIRTLVQFSGQRVVEIGMGNGRLTWPLAREAALWVGLDLEAGQVARAATSLLTFPCPPIRLLISDGRALSLPADYFDVALFTWSLCCLPHAEMLSAVAEARRILHPGGYLLDIHPSDEPTSLAVWHARSDKPDQPEDIESIHRIPIGNLDHDETLRDYTATTDTLAEALESGFSLRSSTVFDYHYSFDTMEELIEYLKEDGHATVSPALLEHARQAMAQMPAPPAPKIIGTQHVMATLLRKTLLTV